MKLTATTFISLDGVLQSPGGPAEDNSLGFDLGGWLVPHVDEGFNAIVGPWFEDADAFLLGRRTYQLMAAHWPNVTDPADQAVAKLNTLPKYVPSATLTSADWHNTHILAGGDLVQQVTDLKAQDGRALQVHGSGRLLQFLLKNRLVDELRLLTFPVTLGKGQRLFEQGVAPTTWKLTDVRSTPAGVIGQTYSYVGAVSAGNIVVGADGKEELEPVR
ncbi:dihydrofolate reductase family protein [Saccharopolyspora sp. NPDC050642]|uniref:dihydrofolate reductase family protein n=1 Tax=Saccharopolyspora sp. NPDC050642 TaxID=3157099 RepID=UPI0033F3EC63